MLGLLTPLHELDAGTLGVLDILPAGVLVKQSEVSFNVHGGDSTHGTARRQRALLSCHVGVQALLRDPARLQSLLERNPQLMSLLKARLGMA